MAKLTTCYQETGPGILETKEKQDFQTTKITPGERPQGIIVALIAKAPRKEARPLVLHLFFWTFFRVRTTRSFRHKC